MFRFYRITTFLDGHTFIDFSDPRDPNEVNEELALGGPLGIRTYPFHAQDFLIYEG